MNFASSRLFDLNHSKILPQFPIAVVVDDARFWIVPSFLGFGVLEAEHLKEVKLLSKMEVQRLKMEFLPLLKEVERFQFREEEELTLIGNFRGANKKPGKVNT